MGEGRVDVDWEEMGGLKTELFYEIIKIVFELDLRIDQKANEQNVQPEPGYL